MYNVSNNFLTAIKQNGRTFKSTATIRDVTFDDNNIILIDLDENVNPDESFMLGGVGSSKLDVTIANPPSNLTIEDASVTATISLLVNGTYEDVPLGVFTVDDIDKEKNTVKITCYDNMIKLEKAYFSDLSYPADINDVAQEICIKAGVELASTIPHIQINKIQGYTCREAIGFIASFLGGFARFNREGELEIISYIDTGFSITGDNYFKLNTNQKPFTIGRLACKAGTTTDSNGNAVDNILTAGTTGIEIQFENPIMTQEQLNSIYNVLKDLSYMPYSMDWQGNQALQAGDKITITDVDNNVYNTLVMDNKITYKGAITGSCAAVGKTETSQEFSSSGSLKNSVDRLVIEQANIKVLLANTATIEDLNATNARIDNLVVGTAQIEDASITTAKIAYAAVGTAQIQTGAITNALIDTAAVGTTQIADASITDAKIVDLTANKITAGTLSVERLEIRGTTSSIVYALNNITGALQSQNVDTLNGEIVTPRTITADKIVADAITANEIAAHTITANELVLNTITAASGIIASIDASVITVGTLDASRISVVNLSADSITSGDLNSIRINSTVGSSKLTINGGYLKTYNTDGTSRSIVIQDQSVSLYTGFNDTKVGAVEVSQYISSIGGNDVISLYAENGYSVSLGFRDGTYVKPAISVDNTNGQGEITIWGWHASLQVFTSINCNNYDMQNVGALNCGSLSVSGAKQRIVATEHYGTRAFNAYETTECYFGDMKRNYIVNGMCIIDIDALFLEAVTANIQYEVFVSPYGNGKVWVDPNEMYPTYFIVRGSADIPFVWEVKVKQRGFENTRMESVKMQT